MLRASPVINKYSFPITLETSMQHPQAEHPSRRGILVSLEGGEGSGKTSLLPRLATALRIHGHEVVETREPGGTPIGLQLRALLVEAEHALPPTAELFLMEAARVIHMDQVIQPALKRGAIVLTDRFVDSTHVYQGALRQLNRDLIAHLNWIATNGRFPDLTLYLDVDPEIGLARRRKAGPLTHFDRESLLAHQSIRQAFQRRALDFPDRIRTVDAGQTPEIVFQQALAILETYLGTQDSH